MDHDGALPAEQARRTEAWAAEHNLVGMSDSEARAAVEAAGLVLRVVLDGRETDDEVNLEFNAVTADFRPNRVNVELVDGRVSRVGEVG